MHKLESRLSNSLVARHHSQFNSMMSFPQKMNLRGRHPESCAVGSNSILAKDMDELIGAVTESQLRESACLKPPPSQPSQPIMLQDMLATNSISQVPFSAGIQGSRTNIQERKNMQKSLKPLPLEKVHNQNPVLNQNTERNDETKQLKMASSRGWQSVERASTVGPSSIVKLEQDKLITKRQVMDFLNMNDKLKQIRERLVDPGTS